MEPCAAGGRPGTIFSAPSVAQVGNQTVIAAQGPNDTLVFYWQPIGSGTWNPEQVAGPGTTSSAPSVAQVGNQTVIAAQGPNDTLVFYWQPIGSGTWNPEQVAGPGTTSSAPSVAHVGNQTVIAAQGPNDSLAFYWQPIGSGTWNPEQVGGTVPAPASGLGSNSNYILYSDCNSLINLSVTIKVTEDMVWQSASGPTDGFGFQLNAYSPAAGLCAYQQYVIFLSGTELIGGIDNWPVSGTNLINDFFNLTSLPSVALPAGYVLQISLGNDNNSNVVAATYVVIDNLGNTQANMTRDLLSLDGVTSADLAPITAFELNLVGPINGESAVLSSGAGTITYEAVSVLTVLNQEPPCTETGSITEETAQGPGKVNVTVGD